MSTKSFLRARLVECYAFLLDLKEVAISRQDTFYVQRLKGLEEKMLTLEKSLGEDFTEQVTNVRKKAKSATAPKKEKRGPTRRSKNRETNIGSKKVLRSSDIINE